MSWLDRLKALDAEARLLAGHCQNRHNPGFVSFDGASEAHIPAQQPASEDADREAFEERAAIMEYDGGMTRAEADRMAAAVHLPPSEPPTVPLAEMMGLAQDERGKEGLDIGDLRPCSWCRNLARSGRCMAAWRGELRAARDYSPTYPDQPRRCICYLPGSRDPDLATGSERWPEMIPWQAAVPRQN